MSADSWPLDGAQGLLEELEMPPSNASKEWFQQRGRALEDLVTRSLNAAGLFPRSRYRPIGEEIDGSFVFGNRAFLFEAKWRREPLPASDLYAFKGKIDGKLVGTIGVVISMSGFAGDAVDALIAGKAINLILFDREDFRLTLVPWGGFEQVLSDKLRAAAELGTPYKRIEIETLYRERERKPVKGQLSGSRGPSRVTFIVEGAMDEIVIRTLVSRLVSREGGYNFVFQVAGGKRNISLLARENYGYGKTIAIADSDGNVESARQMLSKDLQDMPIEVIIVHPHIEAWLDEALQKMGINKAELKQTPLKKRSQLYAELALQVDMDLLAKEHHGFRQLLDIIDRKDSLLG